MLIDIFNCLHTTLITFSGKKLLFVKSYHLSLNQIFIQFYKYFNIKSKLHTA